jgi:hypothetical protein
MIICFVFPCGIKISYFSTSLDILNTPHFYYILFASPEERELEYYYCCWYLREIVRVSGNVDDIVVSVRTNVEGCLWGGGVVEDARRGRILVECCLMRGRIAVSGGTFVDKLFF